MYNQANEENWDEKNFEVNEARIKGGKIRERKEINTEI